MKKLFLLLCVIAFVFLTVQGAGADSISFLPSPQSDLNDLDHYKYYTWGIDWTIPSGDTIVSASLSFDNIRNWKREPNDLWVHLLDSSTTGVAVGTDNPVGGDFFAGLGPLLNHWQNLPATAVDITYNFVSGDLTELIGYLGDGNFGLGFDPDCHFLNDGITLTLNTAPVPIPGAFLLFGSGLIGLAGYRRKKSKS